MPKRKKIAEKNVNVKETAGNKRKELDELGSLFKTSKPKAEGHEEESELENRSGVTDLEEDVDDLNLNLNALEFHQIMQLTGDSAETGAPVLERIAGSAPRPIFVGGIPQGTGTAAGTEESKDEFKYVPGTADANEPKYFEEPGIRTAPERIDFTRAGRNEFRQEINQEAFFERASEVRGMGFQPQSPERFERPERFDAEKERAQRRNPFERPEQKYEKYRPKLPKS